MIRQRRVSSLTQGIRVKMGDVELSEEPASWHIPAIKSSPTANANTCLNEKPAKQRLQYSQLASIFQNLEQRCQECSDKVEEEACQAIKAHLEAWIKARERLYATQLREALEHFKKTALAEAEAQHAAKHRQELADEKAKLAEQHYKKLQDLHAEREQLVQRRLEVLRNMELAMISQKNLEARNSFQHAETAPIQLQITVSEPEKTAEIASYEAELNVLRSQLQQTIAESEKRELEHREAKRELLATIHRQSNDIEDRETQIDKLKEEKEAAANAVAAAIAHRAAVDAELQAVKSRLEEESKLSNDERLALEEMLKSSKIAEAAAIAAKEQSIDRCRQAEAACRTADTQVEYLRNRAEELGADNSKLQKEVEAARKAVLEAKSAESVAIDGHQEVVGQLASSKTALDTQKSAIMELQMQLQEYVQQLQEYKSAAHDYALLEASVAAWEERALQHIEDTRLHLAATLRDAEAVCYAAKSLGTAGPACAGPLLATVQEIEEKTTRVAAWLNRTSAVKKELEQDSPTTAPASGRFGSTINTLPPDVPETKLMKDKLL